MRWGPFDFVEYTWQLGHDYRAQLCRGAGSHAASLVERSDHSIQGIVLTKEENFVLAAEVVVEICRGKGRRCRNVAHAGLRKPAHAKLSPRGAQDLHASRKIAPPEMAVTLTLHLVVGQLHSPALERRVRCRVEMHHQCPPSGRLCLRIHNNDSERDLLF